MRGCFSYGCIGFCFGAVLVASLWALYSGGQVYLKKLTAECEAEGGVLVTLPGAVFACTGSVLWTELDR